MKISGAEASGQIISIRSTGVALPDLSVSEFHIFVRAPESRVSGNGQIPRCGLRLRQQESY